MLECFSKMELRNYYAGDVMAVEGMPCKELVAIINGNVCIEHMRHYQVIHSEIKNNGDLLGEWAILGDKSWVQLPQHILEEHDEMSDSHKTLHAYICSARGLKQKDLNGASDPYLTLQVGNGEIVKTKVIRKNLHPEWKQRLELRVLDGEIAAGQVMVQVWDADTFGEDGKHGKFSLQLSLLDTCNHCPIVDELTLDWHKIYDDAGVEVGEVALGMLVGTPSPLEIMTKVTCTTFVSCKVLTKANFEKTLALYPSIVKEKIDHLYEAHLLSIATNTPADASDPVSASRTGSTEVVADRIWDCPSPSKLKGFDGSLFKDASLFEVSCSGDDGQTLMALKRDMTEMKDEMKRMSCDMHDVKQMSCDVRRLLSIVEPAHAALQAAHEPPETTRQGRHESGEWDTWSEKTRQSIRARSRDRETARVNERKMEKKKSSGEIFLSPYLV